MKDLVSMPEETLESLVGKTIAQNYQLQEYIGEGSFGGVFKSTQSFLGVPVRSVAIKVSRQTQMDGAYARALFADAFLLAQVMDQVVETETRRHLVHIYDMGLTPEEGRGFIVMEYIRGSTLAAQFASFTQVPTALLLKWVRQVCQALSGLHLLQPPFLHRDLKPDNILLGIDHTIHIVDFGLATQLLHRGYAPGIVGTFAYMAPETLKGESVPASDVYSIGLILYTGLTGIHPFSNLRPVHEIPEQRYRDWLYEQKKTRHLPPPSFFNKSVPETLDDLVMRCLDFSVARRYQNAGELLRALAPETQPDPPEVVALLEGRRLRNRQKLAEARRTLEFALAMPIAARETRFLLQRELGELLLTMADYQAAARHLAEAWQQTSESALLRTRADRVSHLQLVIKAYRLCGEENAAALYEAALAHELRAMKGE